MLLVGWAQPGCSAPHEVSGGCTHQGFSGAYSVQGGSVPWLQPTVASCGLWLGSRQKHLGASIPKVPGGSCRTSYDSASEVSSSGCTGQTSHYTLEARGHAFHLSLVEVLSLRVWRKWQLGWVQTPHTQLNASTSLPLTPPWGVTLGLWYPPDFFLPAPHHCASHSPWPPGTGLGFQAPTASPSRHVWMASPLHWEEPTTSLSRLSSGSSK